MRRHSTGPLVVGVLVCGSLLAPVPAHQAQEAAPLDRAAAHQLFADATARYSALRLRYEATLPPFDVRRDAWSLKLSRLFLASAIRSARHTARIGDLFTEPVARMFRADLAGAIADTDIEGLGGRRLDNGEPLIDLVVNEPVPAWAMQEVPAPLLERLPPLPDAMEYRVVDSTLILWDAHAEILIDALPGALVDR
jgi:hypothetical protein